MSRRNFLTQKASRSERDYGLPRLTIEQFAREVDASPQDVVVWLGKLLYEKVIDHARWSRWTNDTEPISPALIRLYLIHAASAKAPPRPERPSVPSHESKRVKR